MPESAIAHVAVDYVLPVSELAGKVTELVASRRRRNGYGAPSRPPPRKAFDELDGPDPPGMRTDITCPQCGGVLWEEVEDRITIYRCRAGHVYSPDSLLAVQGEGLDSAIWRPIRMLHERGALLRRLAARASSQGRDRSARYFSEEAEDTLRRAAEMRRVVAQSERTPEQAEEPEPASLEEQPEEPKSPPPEQPEQPEPPRIAAEQP
jgi:two-component system chemotaxis response regulator CheB